MFCNAASQSGFICPCDLHRCVDVCLHFTVTSTSASASAIMFSVTRVAQAIWTSDRASRLPSCAQWPALRQTREDQKETARIRLKPNLQLAVSNATQSRTKIRRLLLCAQRLLTYAFVTQWKNMRTPIQLQEEFAGTCVENLCDTYTEITISLTDSHNTDIAFPCQRACICPVGMPLKTS